MTKIVNDPEEFPKDSLAGFTEIYGDYVQPVHGGVVRAAASPESEVALVVGGGSGHYPDGLGRESRTDRCAATSLPRPLHRRLVRLFAPRIMAPALS